MIALLLLGAVGPAHADPLVLRAPQSRLAVVVGLPDTSVAWWFSESFGVSADFHPSNSVGLSAGYRLDVARAKSGFGLEIDVSGGPMYNTLEPGLILGVSPAVQVGFAKKKVNAELGVVAPVVVQLAPDQALRVPVLGELWLGGQLGAVYLGGHLGAGPMWVLGAPNELAWELGLDLGFGKIEPAKR